MEFSGDTLYQVFRILFAISLLGFLYLVIRVTLQELQQPLRNAVGPRAVQARAQLITLPGEAGASVVAGQVFEIEGMTTLGRAQTAGVLLDDSSVSAQHAIVRSTEGGWTIEDLGSRNGTLVNGRPIIGSTPLICGDAFQLGRVRLRLMC